MTGLLLKLSIGTAAGFFLGKYFYTTYKDRRKYYSGLVDFIGALSNNLSFRQEKLPALVKEYSAKTNDVFKAQLDNFYDYISSGSEFRASASEKTAPRLKTSSKISARLIYLRKKRRCRLIKANSARN